MPVILPEEYFQASLSGAAGNEVFSPYKSDLMSAWPISTRTRVNSPPNHDQTVFEPM
jgi:hypothetical protein